MKISEYERGHQDAIRAAVTWLHAEAKSMNDTHARRLMDGAAFGLGVSFSQPAAKERVKRASRHVSALPPQITEPKLE